MNTEDEGKHLEQGESPFRSSADMAPGRKANKPDKDESSDFTSVTEGVPVVPEEVAVEEAVVWDPSVYDESEEGTIFEEEVEIDANVRWVRHRRPLGPIPRWGLVIFLLLVGLTFTYRKVDQWVNSLVAPDTPPGDEVEFVIEPGWSSGEVAVALGSAGVIDNSPMFRQWMRCHSTIGWFIDCPAGVEYSFQAGDYLLQEHLAFQDVVDILNEGPIPPEVVRVTIPEGLTISQMVTKIKERMPTYSEAQLNEAFSSDVVRWEHYPTEFFLPWYEGMFFPDTYQLDEATLTDEMSLVTRMHSQFLTVVEEIDLETKAAAVGLTPYEALVVASLIEEEALLNDERAKISQVIHNRLEQGWSLGLESTVRYAAGKTSGESLTSDDLNSDSPWNTWIEPGLPLTPISAPGRASLEAAVNPEDGPWMFFVRTDENGIVGAHTFAVTSEEFAEAVAVCREKDLGCG